MIDVRNNSWFILANEMDSDRFHEIQCGEQWLIKEFKFILKIYHILKIIIYKLIMYDTPVMKKKSVEPL